MLRNCLQRCFMSGVSCTLLPCVWAAHTGVFLSACCLPRNVCLGVFSRFDTNEDGQLEASELRNLW